MRFYSAEWIEAFNNALRGLDPDPDVSLSMLQLVHGGPDGTLRLFLEVASGAARLVSDPPDGTVTRTPQVTVSLAYQDATALSQGALEPASLLAAGRVKVRGDLGVLVKGHALLAAAAARLGPLSAETTYSVVSE